MLRNLAILVCLSSLQTTIAWPFNQHQYQGRQASKPPVPSVSDLHPHLVDVPENRCMFYTGGTLVAAAQYADNNDLFVLGDLDKDGWAAPSQKDDQGEDDYNAQCPMSWAFQEPLIATGANWDGSDRDAYFDNLSKGETTCRFLNAGPRANFIHHP